MPSSPAGPAFIGSNLVDPLVARGDHLVVVDDLSTGKRENLNGSVRLVELDIRSPELADLLAETERKCASTSPRRRTFRPRPGTPTSTRR